MKVYKFGGTSVGSPENMRMVRQIITDGEPKLVVLSAMSGTTNSLVEISSHLYQQHPHKASEVMARLEEKYARVVEALYATPEYREKGQVVTEGIFRMMRLFLHKSFTLKEEKILVAQGELLSTQLFTLLMQESGHSTFLLPALDFMRVDEERAADLPAIRTLLLELIDNSPRVDYYITQGFICRNPAGEIDNLERGGSDYTASLVGAAIDAEEVQIWTDIDGFHNNDPRFVSNTRKIDQLSFNEAAELAYFGAKILHPQTIFPARIQNIPVRLKNTMNPSDSGTLITTRSDGSGIKAVAAKDGITAIKIRSGRMLMAYGFLKKVFEIFERHKTPIDMISTSEVAVSLTVDNTRHLEEIHHALMAFGEVEIDRDMSIICIVGDIIREETGFASRVFNALDGIPIRMISYGGSRYNISVLVPTSHKTSTLQTLSDKLLNASF
ncbi:MAG TPA: aspartate kinase [Prolixibacteraceae bacterium]|jgi:aspartate kinase|nr:aspartate kinase [Bacteroidales bacterium]HPJ78178.1 aspartate kinase [Prolixibacteraceae bacterium]HRV89585.1 aspartate kinase [Prolixibacteraceae bacterium]